MELYPPEKMTLVIDFLIKWGIFDVLENAERGITN